MVEFIIFDLSEVLIAGLVGIEKDLSRLLSLPEDRILPCFEGRQRDELFLGDITEDAYLDHVIARGSWEIGTASLKQAIRDNFHREVEGSLDILVDLAFRYELVLLSDHAQEWVPYIRSVHPFMTLFKQGFFSYDLRRLKKDPETYSVVLNAMGVPPHNCLFVDDNVGNIRAAESVGLAGIHFVNARQLVAALDRKLGFEFGVSGSEF